MRILKVCLDDPSEARKGDAKLISERTRCLERQGVIVDVLYFNYRLTGSRVSVKEKKRSSRLGKDIVVKLCLQDIGWHLISGFRLFGVLPIQTWLSFALARATRGVLREISQPYDAVHIYHIRSIGIWGEIPHEKNAIYDIIDSYSLNLRCRLLIETNIFWRALLTLEYKRMTVLEGELERFIGNPRKASIVAVAEEDLEYVNSAIANKKVVPVGVDIKTRIDKDPISFKELRCIFFGNLNYEPNINACREVRKLAEAVNSQGLGSNIRFTVAGRNISRRLAYDLESEGISVLSPVKDMMKVVGSHNVAIIPMVSGSGMQSKVLEALQWGCLLIATKKAVIPLALEEGREYLVWDDIDSTLDILKRIMAGRSNPEEILARGRDYVKRFSWEKTCEELVSLYINPQM